MIKLSTMYRIFKIIKRPLRFLKDYGVVLLLLIAIGILIYLCFIL